MRANEGKKEKTILRRLLTYVGRFFVWLFVTILILLGGLYEMLYFVNKGPSTHVRDLFVASVMESSAGGILAEIYLSDDEIAKIQARNRTVESDEITDASMVTVAAVPGNETAESDSPADAASENEWGYVYDDPDGDGIEIHEVHGETYSGMMMIVYDPSRVVVSAIPQFTHGYRGWTLQQHVENNGAVAGINGGKYEDESGLGSGAWPEGIVISRGELRAGSPGATYGVYGFNEDNILICGKMSAAYAQSIGIRDAVTFGPALIVNGRSSQCSGVGGGLNPRTAIGQRPDGAVLLLVIEGRKTSSLGASMADLIDVMLEYGAVNAANLDGGMSSSMFYNGEKIVDNCTVRDTRSIPTAFIVLPQEHD
ncbi:MAG: phosphodiester glycosidase family protein [Lachnospiraceae bacterium]|nr:phosphodiester glycosidase family protein [Lachnospiraceae bacterium]